jgi:hypothetical protein
MSSSDYQIEFKGSIDRLESKVYDLHIKVPPAHAETIIATGNKRMICLLDHQFEIRSALMPSKDGWMILINQQLTEKLRSEDGLVHVQLKPDHSEYGMEMPEELSIMLEQDSEANDHFHKLTPGKQRNLIYIVSKVKNTDSRIKKALAICTHLKEVHGKLDFKRLNETIKYYNNNY